MSRQVVVDAERLVLALARLGQVTFGRMADGLKVFLDAVKTRSGHLGVDDLLDVDLVAN